MGIDSQLSYEFDVFVSHASEDKARFVEPLIAALRERGILVWYDAEQIRLGDDFRRKMDEGLSRARFGVVILSPRFFKYWPEAELSALFAQEAAFDVTRILPIRCDLDRATVVSRSPLLSARADVGWEMGVHVVAERIHEAVRRGPIGARLARSPVYNLPSRRARQLFGRELDLRQLDALLVPGRSVQVAASIEGLAGVGKTELALHIVNRLAETGRFPGGIFWFDAENPDLTTAWGSVIADALAVGPGTIDERAAGALRFVSTGAPVLIVLDNVERWTRGSEPKPLPRGPQIALLVTTRHKFLAGPAFDHHTLEVLPAEAAREFLVSVAGRDLTHSSSTKDLLNYLDCHSLAIELAGAYLREFPSITPAEYLRRLKEGLPAEEKVQDLVRYEATVRNALDVHWTNLDDAAREGLLVVACFAAEDATIALLDACGVDAEAQQPLRRFHLITGDGERWRMHRLVREWALNHAAAENLALAKRKFVEGCANYSLQITLREGFRIYRSDGKHLEQATQESVAVFGANDPRVSFLHDRLAAALHSIGDLPRAKELGEFALALSLTNLEEDHPSVSSGRSNLALVLKELGELPRAKELLELALASDLKNLREDHPNVSTRRSNLALVLQKMGDLPRAKDLLELALASDLKNRGEDYQAVSIERHNLAALLKEVGDLSAARVLFTQALSAAERSLGADHPSTALSRASLSDVISLMGETESARIEVERAVRSVADQPAGSRFRIRVERIAERVLGRT